MPATRTSSIPPRPRHVPIPNPPKNRVLTTHDSEVISLSSSEGESPRVPPTKRKQTKPQATARTKKPISAVPLDEVIEISDDDSSTEVPTRTSVIADFRRQNNRLREESMKHKRDFERASRELREVKEENRQLQALCKPDNGKITLDANQLTEQLDCEICNNRMWTPYILPDCGHAFCLACLQNWFGRIKREFIEANPQNNPQLLLNASTLTHAMQTIAQNPHLAQHQHFINMFAQLMPPQPNYTCPTCREPVRSHPTEVFILKSLVRTLSTAAGETSPQKKGSSSRKGKAPAPRGDLWDGFFPPKRT